MQSVVELTTTPLPDLDHIKRLRDMATIAIPAKLTVVHVICAMAISTCGRHFYTLCCIPIMTGQAVNAFVRTIQRVICLHVVIKLPQ